MRIKAGQLFTSRRRSVIAAASLAAACLVGLSVASAGVFRRAARPAAATAPTGQQSQAQGPHVEAELITFRLSGVDPAEIRRPPGPFILAVENMSGIDLGALRLDPEQDTARPSARALAEAHMPRERLNWTQPLDLPPGAYTLRRADDPTHACRIVIESR